MKPKSTFRYLIVFLFILLNSFSQNAKAQMVLVPDSNFRNALIAQGFGACITGNYIDASCSMVVNCTQLNLQNSNIFDLTGIIAFSNLQSLDCSVNGLTSLPQLPSTLGILNCNNNNLTSLFIQPTIIGTLFCNNNQLTTFPSYCTVSFEFQCRNNKLTSLPHFNNMVYSIWCDNNQLTSLPTLPNSLLELHCEFNQLSSLPTLPISLGQLYCNNNKLSALPNLPALYYLDCDYNLLANLPPLTSIQKLTCEHNLLTSLPTLPSNLRLLGCGFNQLTTLPTLPSSLSTLGCYYNQIASLPNLQNVTSLSCEYNQLTTLPALPDTLTNIYCNNNNLTSLPAFPDSLNIFNCSFNPNLSCFPPFKIINSLNFDSTNVSCLPNYGTVYNSTPLLSSVPLCDFFNQHGCTVYWNINGNTYYDADTNCVYNSGDNRLSNYNIKLFKNGILNQQAFTGGEGYYSFDTDSLTAYQTVIDTTGIPFTVHCPASFSYSDTLVANDTLKYNRDFALECKTGFDLAAWSVNATRIRIGHIVTVNNSAGDYSNLFGGRCASGIGGIVNIIYSGSVHYVSPASGALAPTTISGDTLTYTVADFGLVNAATSFNFLMSVDTTAQIGSQVCINIAVSPATDNNPANNTISHCFTVRSSFDPNEKEVSPQSNLDINGDRWLTYTINFQNTGTAPAEHISILDTLNSNLDASTFQLLAYSKQPYVQILNGGIAKFNFPNINLPDSSSDETNSHGYVQYRIKALDSLAAGTPISNTASIYFDFNTPVVTNTVVDSVINCVANIQNTTITACANEYIFNGLHLTQSGNYIQKFTTNSGCDSIVNLALTLYPVYLTSINQSVCDGDSINFYGQFYSQTGNYSQHFTSISGCDSSETLLLNVIPKQRNITGTFCSNSSYNFNGQTLTLPGMYVDSLTNVLGCDSIIQLNLQQNLSYNDSISQSICYGDAVFFDNNFLTQPGVYTQTLPTIAGCDSVTTLTLDVTPVYTINYSQTICAGEAYFFDGQTITQSGVYTQALATAFGCDSITTLTLNVQPIINTTVTQSHDTLTATETNASYQWYDCVSGNLITNATTQSFTPTTSGYYAVILTSGNCIDSSLCQYISITGITENNFNDIIISPNPSSDEFIISSPQKNKNTVSIKVFDAFGKLILQKQISASKTILKAESWSAGIYFMEISDGENTSVRKLVKE